MGLEQVKELTRRTIERIRRGRPFHSLEDFLARADPRPQEATSLARVGALQGLGTIPGILRRLEEGGAWRSGQPGLFDWLEPGEEDWTLGEKVAAQQEILGAAVDAHPLELVAPQVARAGAITTTEAVARVGRRVLVAGVRQSGRRSKTAKGEWMMFLTLEDLEGMLDVVVFPDAYRRAREALSSPGPLLVSGVVERDSNRDEPLLRADVVSLIK
jgi:DNA polymerase-3 subunit alpha